MTKKLLRFLGYAVVGAVGLVILASAAVYGLSERLLDRTFHGTDVPVEVPTDEASIAEGRRLATIRGCNDGCHGEGTSGAVFFDEPLIGRIVAPDLTRVAASHSDVELERIIRQGIRRDGTSTLIMPSSMFYPLTDEDLGKIIAFLRSQPATGGPATEIRLWPLPRWLLLRGEVTLQAEEVQKLGPRTEPDRDDPLSLGRYLAVTSCTECHGLDLAGSSDGSIPDLRQALAYDRDDFRRLMRDGISLAGEELGLMAVVARKRFSQFTEDEVEALLAYLHSRGN